jgi:Fur family transcriptional regulator, ferric uptake regulator
MAFSQILKVHNLRQTSCRKMVLELLLEREIALSHHDFEQQAGQAYDRVTLYRTLKTFLDKGIIHKVLDDSGVAKYALCNAHCPEEEHHDDHVHFKCTQCGTTSCLEHTEIPPVKLPEGYSFTQVNLLVQGVCRECSLSH